MKNLTTKVTAESLRILRMIAAATGELQYVAMDRVLKAELIALKKAKKI